eukprot:TRINITY_DN7650_c0_g2_i1.p1 TRINITY_DN7650_c0_g2~~TRINITY_DN7650_c0_g2_i1.p1  ORF type:complete len:262 (+),score=39.39 TRINITY_DN7650_c0_g2_i1:79-864(+)
MPCGQLRQFLLEGHAAGAPLPGADGFVATPGAISAMHPSVPHATPVLVARRRAASVPDGTTAFLASASVGASGRLRDSVASASGASGAGAPAEAGDAASAATASTASTAAGSGAAVLTSRGRKRAGVAASFLFNLFGDGFDTGPNSAGQLFPRYDGNPWAPPTEPGKPFPRLPKVTPGEARAIYAEKEGVPDIARPWDPCAAYAGWDPGIDGQHTCYYGNLTVHPGDFPKPLPKGQPALPPPVASKKPAKMFNLNVDSGLG